MSVNSEKIRLMDVRLSFPRLWEARAFQEGQAKRYEASFLLDPTREDHQEVIAQIEAEAERIAKEEFKGKVPAKLEYCFGEGNDQTNDDGEVYDGYADMWYIRTAKPEKRGPITIVDRDRSPLTEEDGKPYGGCYVEATITLWTQNNQWGKRVNANIRAIRFLRDGDAFGTAPVDADDEFDEIPDGDDEDFLNMDD